MTYVRQHSLALIVSQFAVIASLLAPASVHATAKTCSSIFKQSMNTIGAPKLANVAWKPMNESRTKGSKIEGLVRSGVFTSESSSTNGLKLAFDIVSTRQNKPDLRGRNRPVIVLLHGIADARQNLDALANEWTKQGYTVIRPDFLGHGETAKLNPSDQVTRSIEPSAQIEMVRGLLSSLGVERAVTVGHSVGGGLSLLISADLKQSGIDVVANIAVAPYLSPIDKFTFSRAMTPETLKMTVEKMREESGLATLANLRTELLKMMPFGETYLNSSRALMLFWTSRWQAALNASLYPFLQFYDGQSSIVNKMIDRAADPAMIEVMKAKFREYAAIKNEKLAPEDRASDAEISLQVHGAVEAMIGLRSVNFQNRVNPTPIDSNLPTLIIFGKDDPVVTPAQVEDFKHVAQSRSYKMAFAEVDANHFIPQILPSEVVQMTLQFIEHGQSK